MLGRHENSSDASQHIEVFRLKSGTECSAGAGDIFLSYFIFAISLGLIGKHTHCRIWIARILCLFLRPAHMQSASPSLSPPLSLSPSLPSPLLLSQVLSGGNRKAAHHITGEEVLTPLTLTLGPK